MKEKKYLCGIDLGTDSCGFCVTDQDGKIVRKNGKDLWGVRLFDESHDCSERRSYRTGRRRLQRRRHRIELLQSIFAGEIEKVDPKFFIRLNESQLHYNDKSTGCKYVLFADEGYTDKEFYSKENYPTIYHLRKDLLESNEKKDIRLIYLALAHMVKYRGNFLSEGTKYNLSDRTEIIKSFNEIRKTIEAIYPDEDIDCFDSEKIDDVLKASKEEHDVTKLKEKYQELLNPGKNKFVKDVLITLLAGGSAATSKIVSDEELIEEKKNITCGDEDLDLTISNLAKVENEEEQNKVCCLKEIKKIYDFIVLNKLLEGSEYISEAMVKSYEEHKKDLKQLKAYVRAHCPEEYDGLFRDVPKDEKKANYSTYIGSTNNDSRRNRVKHADKQDFYKAVKKVLNLEGVKPEMISDPYLKEVYNKMKEGTYLPRQNSSANRVIPYQLNLQEMEVILNNQSKYYDFLNEKDKYGTNIEKIESILEFKIPYYVGPLSGAKHSEFSWVVRADEKIYPWNFNEVVDKEQTAEQFIKRMLNKCSYLADQYCLPKDSIIYNKFIVLNEVNKLFVNGNPIAKEDKDLLLKEVYAKKKKVSVKTLAEALSAHHNNTKIEVTMMGQNQKEGKEAVLHGNMKSYVQFCEIFGEDYVSKNIDLIDEMISDSAIFSEDKKLFGERLSKKYRFDSETIKKIKGLTFGGFGKLSKKLLTELRGISEDGEVLGNNSIMDVMENTSMNFMEIINSDKYGFGQAIKAYNSEIIEDNKSTFEDFVDNAYVSPGMKRPLIQAYRITEELEKILKHPIDEYYIECTRSNKSKKEEKKSRKENIKDMLANATKIAGELNKKILDECNEIFKAHEKEDDGFFRSDAVYLYFTQLGRDIYTGKEIDFKDISNRKEYDIDHIYPQSLVKDDSLDNRVLVSCTANSEKKDIYPIPYSKIAGTFKHKAFQHMLRECGLISEKKYARLTRETPLDDKDIFNFTSRQIVYTSQSVKALKDLILEFKKDSEGKSPKVILSKAENVSDYRKDYDLLKSRDANNCHHAHDAFLNIMIGRTINTYFGGDNLARLQYLKENGYTTNPRKIFEKKNKSDIIDSGGNIVWCYSNDTTKNYIDKQIKKNHNMLFSTRSYYGTSLFAKTSIKTAKYFEDKYKRDKDVGDKDVGDGAFPVKQIKNGPLSALSDVSKYGGYTDLSFGSYTLFKCVDKKGKETHALIAIPAIIGKNSGEEAKIKYAKEKCHLNNPSIEVDNLKINTCIVQGNSKFCVTGKTGNRFVVKNLKEAFFDYDSMKTIRKVSKLNEFVRSFKNSLDDTFAPTPAFKDKYSYRIDDNNDSFTLQIEKQNTEKVVVTKQELLNLYQTILKQLHNNIYEKYTNIQTQLSALEKDDKIQKVNSLNVFGLSKLVEEVLYLAQTNSITSDLGVIGLPKTCGKLSISNFLEEDMKIVAYSITGFYQKVLWEKK